MPSFDIVSEIDMQELDNACNNVIKEVGSRYDFRGVNTEVELNKKDQVIKIRTGDEMKVQAVRDMLISHCLRRKVDSDFLEFGEHEGTSNGQLKLAVKIKEGISKEDAKKIVKLIKAMKLKVQPAIQDQQVRVTGKKLDDLQAVMAAVREGNLGLPLQFVNMKS
ncbi:MAG: YajQ family cyclic di-GMP-binding protein [Desulfovibrio sp.]